MHETSIVQNLFDVIREDYIKNNPVHVTAVTLEVGKFSNIEPVLLNEAFQVMKRETEFEFMKLSVHTVKTIAECYYCLHRFVPDEFPFLCPSCGQFGGKVIQGGDLIIKHIEMEVPDHA